MSITSNSGRWEILHSLWIGWTFIPFLYSIAFFYIGFRTGQKRWTALGAVSSAVFVLFVIALSSSGPDSWQADATGLPWLLMWPASIFYAFWIRKEYLLRLGALQSRGSDPDALLKRRLATEYGVEGRQGDLPASTPTSTSKGKRWELLHSLWIGWALFTFGFLSWVAFAYAGFRAKQKKWFVWGAVYSTPFVLSILSAIVFGGAGSEPKWVTNLGVTLLLIVWPVSIGHAFWIRKEYLLRLQALQRREGDPDIALKRRLAAEYGIEDRQETSAPAPTTFDTTEAVQGHMMVTEKNETPTEEPPSQSHKPPRTVGEPSTRAQPTAAPAPPVARHAVAVPEVLSGDELEYRISSSYPFPLAFGYRSLMSIVDPRDLYREQLRVAENVLAFLGSVSMALLREQDREKADVDPKEYWPTGISPGDWKEIVALCSVAFAGYGDDTLAFAIKRLTIRFERKNSFGAHMGALIRAKNDYKHDRGPTVLEDIADTSRGVQERLRRCMEALAFFTSYPIRQVEDFDVSRRGEGVILRCLRYSGDHPSFPQEEVPFDRALPRGDLFLDLGRLDWVPLFPFMTTMTCSHCKARETYFIDSWDTRRGMARMKSFERGHTMPSTEVSEALTEWASSVRPSTP